MNKTCKRKWMPITDMRIIKEYNTKIITCLTCSNILMPNFVHTGIHDEYECYICGLNGKIIHYCLNCKIKQLYNK